jgi:hypothetical protein
MSFQGQINFGYPLTAHNIITTIPDNAVLPLSIGSSLQGNTLGVTFGDLKSQIVPTYTDCNISIGENALFSITNGTSNVAIGCDSLRNNTIGNINIGIGINALRNNSSGYINTAIGKSSLYSCTNGFQNAAFGADASYNLTTGVGNVSIGYDSGKNITTGSYNTVIGSSTGVSLGGINYSVVLGHSAQATASNQFVIGSSIYNVGAITTETVASTRTWSVIINGVARKILLA